MPIVELFFTHLRSLERSGNQVDTAHIPPLPHPDGTGSVPKYRTPLVLSLCSRIDRLHPINVYYNNKSQLIKSLLAQIQTSGPVTLKPAHK